MVKLFDKKIVEVQLVSHVCRASCRAGSSQRSFLTVFAATGFSSLDRDCMGFLAEKNVSQPLQYGSTRCGIDCHAFLC